MSALIICWTEQIIQKSICNKPKFKYCIIIFGDTMYNRIRDLRTDRDLTQKQVAEILNCSQQVYSNYELGQRDVPTEILIALAKYYNVSVDYILGLTDKTNK